MWNEITSTDDFSPTSCDLDTHADTCCFGKDAFIVNIDHHSCTEATGFSASLGSVKSLPIVTAAVAYDCPITYLTYILIFHQIVYIDELNSHLICPYQLRLAGITVNACPLQFTPISKRSKESHTIQAG
jgi:hypothetical protein